MDNLSQRAVIGARPWQVAVIWEWVEGLDARIDTRLSENHGSVARVALRSSQPSCSLFWCLLQVMALDKKHKGSSSPWCLSARKPVQLLFVTNVTPHFDMPRPSLKCLKI